MKKNDIVQLSITDISAEGQGVARHEGMVVFVPFTAPGDVINAHVMKVNKNHAFAKAAEIVEPSPNREKNSCAVFGVCGGCDYRHISYEAELDIKLGLAAKAIGHMGRSAVVPTGIVPSPITEGYRNKAIMPFAGKRGFVKLGFFAPRSHRLISVENCKLCPPVFAEIWQSALGFLNARGISAYDEETGTGLLRHMYIRRGGKSGEIMVCFVINGPKIPDESGLSAFLTSNFPDIKGILLNIHKSAGNANLSHEFRLLGGRDYILDTVCGLEMRLSASSFYQVNAAAAEKLYEAALNMARVSEGDYVLDLFCGAGAVGLIFAKNHPFSRITGADIEGSAIEDARHNAQANGITNIAFKKADLSKPSVIQNCLEAGYQTVIVDPPRKGLDTVVSEAIAQAAPKQILYISCDPATLARDMRYFGENGYVTQSAACVDLFPRTRHVETVVLMTRSEM